jgi:hypothetical protein
MQLTTAERLRYANHSTRLLHAVLECSA